MSNTKKLTLNRETVSALTRHEAEGIAGAYLPPPSKRFSNCQLCHTVDCTDICGTQLCGNTNATQCFCTVSMSPTECSVNAYCG